MKILHKYPYINLNCFQRWKEFDAYAVILYHLLGIKMLLNRSKYTMILYLQRGKKGPVIIYPSVET